MAVTPSTTTSREQQQNAIRNADDGDRINGDGFSKLFHRFILGAVAITVVPKVVHTVAV